MNNITININGIVHKLVEGGKGSNVCDKCSLAYLCDDANCDVGICIDVFNGGSNSYFTIEHEKL